MKRPVPSEIWRRTGIMGLLATSVWIAACSESTSPPAPDVPPSPPDDPAVVAQFADGDTISLADIDQAVLALPASRRLQESGDTATEWYTSLIREMAIDRVLADDADALDVDGDDELRTARDDIQRQAVVDVYLRKQVPPTMPPTEGEIRQYYERHNERYDRPARRAVSHIFKRGTTPEGIEQGKDAIQALRSRFLAGERFASLAKAHSDSESRHREGQLGWLLEENLPPALAKVIFSLPEGETSDPLVTPEGVHLFLVEKAVEARLFALDEVRFLIQRQIENDRRQAALVTWTETLPWPDGTYRAEGDELKALLNAGDPQAIVLKMNEHTLSVERFRTQLTQALQNGGTPSSGDVPTQFLTALANRERVFQAAVRDGIDTAPEVAATVRKLERRNVLSTLRRRAMERKLTREPEWLQAYYDSNRLRFATPLELEIRHLRVPVAADNRDGVMARLETLATKKSDAADLETEASPLGGSVEDLGWKTLAEIGAIDTRLIALAADLHPGERTPPYRRGDEIALLEVVARREPEAQPLATILPQVRQAYLADQGHRLYRDWADQLLGAAGFVLFEDRLPGTESRASDEALEVPVPD